MFTKPTQEDLNSAIAKLVEIGWATAGGHREGKGAIKLTKLGSAKMHSLGILVSQVHPITLGGFAALSWLAFEHAEKNIFGSES